MVEIANETPDNVAYELRSPGFSINYPDLVNKDIMPLDVLTACEWAWTRYGFAEQKIFVYKYDNVFMTNQGLIVRANDHAIYRSSITQHTSADLDLGIASLECALNEKDYHQQFGSSGLCYKPGHDNYGHWINEMLPKAKLYRDNIREKDFKYIIPPQEKELGAAIASSLNLLSIEKSQIVCAVEPMWFEKLYNVVGLTHHGVFMSPIVFDVANEISSLIEAEKISDIYITRRGRVRSIIHEMEFERILSQNGFVTVDPAEMEFTRQVAIFKGARRIVGAMGAGMANTSFARSETRITTFAPAMMADTFYWFIAGLRKQYYREIRCTVGGPKKGTGDRDRDMEINPEEIIKLIL